MLRWSEPHYPLDRNTNETSGTWDSELEMDINDEKSENWISQELFLLGTNQL